MRVLISFYCGCALSLCILMHSGCCRTEDRPQFVALTMETQGALHALFAFDLEKHGKFSIAYVDRRGKLILRREGVLPEDVFDRYQQKLKNRERSSDTSIVVVMDGVIQLEGQELDDLRCVVLHAPPCVSVSKQIHPSFIRVFGSLP